ncbi:MAG TPA: hypothetical protein VKX17_25600 [Planctomycetota bacterium]|nr:hypothetical protein [Planctomycetota bacterium]
MSRNDLINAFIRCAGIYILVFLVLLPLPAYIWAVANDAYQSVRSMYYNGIGYELGSIHYGDIIFHFLAFVVLVVVGFYLMKGGPWFAKKATQSDGARTMP